MARRAKKHTDEIPVPKNFFNPLYLFLRGLAAIGSPIYFLLNALTKIFFNVLTATTKSFKRYSKSSRKNLKKIRKFKKVRLLKTAKKKFKKIKLPELKFGFNLSKDSLRLESLRIYLLELKILSKLRKLHFKKLNRLQRKRLLRLSAGLVFLLILTSAGLILYMLLIKPLPHPTELGNKTPQVSTKIYDRNGTLLYKIYKNENRSPVTLGQIPIHVRLATLAAEDAEFYDNPGFSVKGIARALIQNAQSDTVQGGSTITQQLVKNVLLTPEKTISRKIKEIILSVEVEATYTKDQILEMYLNQVSYGGTAYGIEEASQEYFGKNVKDINLAEAAFLAGLPQSPTTYSPYGQSPEAGFARQRDVLHLMVVNKFITVEQQSEALNEELSFLPNKNHILAPHFVMYIRQLLVDKYGEDMVEKGGLEVTTSLDLSIQEMAQKVVTDEITKLKSLRVGNGSAVVANPKTGEILAMVGSANYFNNDTGGQVNVITRLRQPGSSIKVVNYAYALAHAGYTAATYINDSPITYVLAGSPPYSPVNYDGKFKGNVTLRTALAESRNIPAVKILASYGVDKMVDFGQSLGITSWIDSSRFGLSLTLGGGAVTTLDMVRVYSTLANEGKTPELMPILTIKDYKGRILESNSPGFRQTLDKRIAFILTNILSDNNARAPEFGFNSYLVIPGHPEVAVKTGTSNDLRDNWTDGYNQDYLVITWVGNNDNSPMSRIASGVTGASPIWNKIMSALLANKDSIDWKVPDGVIKMNCPGGKSEWFLMEKVLPGFCKQTPAPSPSPGISPPNQILEGASTFNNLIRRLKARDTNKRKALIAER